MVIEYTSLDIIIVLFVGVFKSPPPLFTDFTQALESVNACVLSWTLSFFLSFFCVDACKNSLGDDDDDEKIGRCCTE